MINLTLRSISDGNEIVTKVTGVYDGKPVAYKSGNSNIPLDIARLIELNETLYLSRKRFPNGQIKTRWVLED